MIRIREVRVIDDEGEQLGVMPTAQALALAQEKGLDLVEVAPTAVPPVCRILDYGQYKYELQKRERETKKKQKSQTFKEIRLGVKVDVNDLRSRLRRAGQFLDDGDRVKVTVRFRGREISHANLGRDLLDADGGAARGARHDRAAAAPRGSQHVHRDGPAGEAGREEDR